MSNGYGNHSGVGYDSCEGDEYSEMTILDYFRLHNDLVASMEKSLLRGDVNGDRLVDLRDAIVALQLQTGTDTGSVCLDGDGDGRVGMAEAV